MAAPASPTNTSARPTLATALRQLAHGYVRKGGKQSRRKRVDRLCLALDWIASIPGLQGPPASWPQTDLAVLRRPQPPVRENAGRVRLCVQVALGFVGQDR